MAVPKRKKSKSKRDMRRAQNSKPPRVTINACPRCSEPKYPHRICMHCGFYGGKDILHLEATHHHGPRS